MQHDPISDALSFLQQPAFVSGPTWPTAVFWVLVLASMAIAVYAFAAIPSQRSANHLWNWVFRFLIGAVWAQQTLVKRPPYYPDHPAQPFGAPGLAYWMGLMGKSAAIPQQAEFVNNIVLPHFYLFAPVVYSLEVLTAVSLMLGIFVRFWGVIGALQILNLWLGLYNAAGEWPWTYFFLLVLQVIFAVHRYGRSLGLDAVIVARSGARHRLASTLLAEVT